MTGGGTGRCLQTPEANGMGEGWSDAYAEWLQHKDASVPDFVLGAWVYNNPKGVRAYPYSTNATTNPLRYNNLKALNKSHAIGEVWANMLHNVYAALVKGYGWTADSFTNPDCSSGNVVFLRLFFDALLIQPCNPTSECILPECRNPVTDPNKCLKRVMPGYRLTSIAIMGSTNARFGKASQVEVCRLHYCSIWMLRRLRAWG
ncbi:hypothetical protein FRC15_009341 [Serendipita sp. 397]|nr:hypothetical protein FRC15_009341 [Serendipita sp. 397]